MHGNAGPESSDCPETQQRGCSIKRSQVSESHPGDTDRDSVLLSPEAGAPSPLYQALAASRASTIGRGSPGTPGETLRQTVPKEKGVGREVGRAPYRMVTSEKEVSLGVPSRREEGRQERRGERRVRSRLHGASPPLCQRRGGSQALPLHPRECSPCPGARLPIHGTTPTKQSAIAKAAPSPPNPPPPGLQPWWSVYLHGIIVLSGSKTPQSNSFFFCLMFPPRYQADTQGLGAGRVPGRVLQGRSPRRRWPQS